MATAKKVPAKKTVAKKAPAKKAPVKRVLVSRSTIATVKADQQFSMPHEVKEWIERADSIIRSQKSQIVEMEDEIKKLKAYKSFATAKILGMSSE